MSKSSTLANRTSIQEIPLEKWIPFLAEFTRENRGAHGRLEIVGGGADVGDQFETEDRPFDGVSSDIKDRERTVWITFGSTADDNLSHGVHEAAAIRMLPPTAEAGPVLEVEAADGTKSILYLNTLEAFSLPPSGRR